MKQIFDFTAARPPVVTEASLRAEGERRKLQGQTLVLTLVLTLAALATQVILLVLGAVVYETQPLLALLALGYVCLSAAGGGLAALVWQKERRLTQ